jgi:hypothetical protein
LFGDKFGVVFHYPCDEVFGALALRLGRCPQFKVFNPVIVSDAVDVVNVLEGL